MEKVEAVLLKQDELPSVASGLIFAMGSKPLEVLAQHGVVPKNRTITSLRYPKVFPYPGKSELMLSYSAGVVDIDYSKYVDMMLDLGIALRRIKTGSYKPVLGTYRYVTDFDETAANIERMYAEQGSAVDVAIDTETVGFDPLAEWIVSIQLSCIPGTADVMYFGSRAESKKMLKKHHSALEWLLTTDRVSLRAANGKFDLNWLHYHTGITCTNFKFDTMLVGSLLDENRGNSLNLHTKWYAPDLGGYDDEFNQTEDKSEIHKTPKDKFLTYAGGDADACLRVSKEQKRELLADPKLTKFYVKVLHPAARAFEKVERTGILVDVDYYLNLEQEIIAETKKIHKEALTEIGGRLIAKHNDNLNLTKPALIKDFMFSPKGLNLKPIMKTKKTGEPSTSMDHLNMFASHPKAARFIELLGEYGSAQKTLSTYVCKRDADGKICGGFLYHLRKDNRWHATYFLFNGGEDDGGTNTGRLSARDPAVQTIPKHTKWAKKLRRGIIAPPGHLVLANDYSQGELKIAACLSNEPTMIHAYRQGIDLHTATAAILMGMTLDELVARGKEDPEWFDLMRFNGKAGNFGLIYGMGAPGYQQYAKLTYRVDLTMDDAENQREAFFKKYSGLTEWHRQYKSFARTHKYIRSPLGRVRHLPLIASPDREFASKAERQAINAPVQSTLSDFSLWSTAEFDRRGWLEESPVIAMIHDQLVSYVPEDRWEECARRNKEVMENLPFRSLGWNPQLQFTVDCEIGPSLGELKKVKL